MAYCGKCGAKLEEGTKFCPSCGTKIDEIKNQCNHTNHLHNVSDMGRLIVSTKVGNRIKSILLICCIVEFLIGIFMLSSIEILQISLNSELGGLLFGLIVGGLCLSHPFLIILGHRSCCNVYENGVEGMTGLSLSNLNAPM